MAGSEICKGHDRGSRLYQPSKKRFKVVNSVYAMREREAGKEKFAPLLDKRTKSLRDLLKMNPPIAGSIHLPHTSQVPCIPNILGVFDERLVSWREGTLNDMDVIEATRHINHSLLSARRTELMPGCFILTVCWVFVHSSCSSSS